MNIQLRNVPFSPPDMTEAEANEVRDAILSGWITTGPRTKKLEKKISEYVHTQKTVCLNSATAAMEMVLHLLGMFLHILILLVHLWLPMLGQQL